MKRYLTLLVLTLISVLCSAQIYIDPTAKTDGNGSKAKPFKALPAQQSNETYLFKCGTTSVISNQIYISGKSQVTIGSYGKGTRPVIKYTGSSSAVRIENSNYITIRDIEITGTPATYSLVYIMGLANQYLLFIRIENCSLSNAHNQNNAGFGVYAWYCHDLKVIGCTVSNVALDGFYCRYTPGIEIGYCNVFDINRRYFQNTNQKYSSGDGIQLDGNYNGFYVHNTTIQRNNGAGNKFGMILASAPGVSDNATGLIEKCVFVTDQAVTTSLHIERGNGIQVRGCTFLGQTQGIRIGGQYAKNTLIEDCTFENCSRGIGVGATYPGGYPATGTMILNNYFEGTEQYSVWTDKATVIIGGNMHNGKPGSIDYYNFGGGKYVEQK